MVYKRYIKKNGKLIGPYFYKSVREGDKVRTVYLGRVLKKSKVTGSGKAPVRAGKRVSARKVKRGVRKLGRKRVGKARVTKVLKSSSRTRKTLQNGSKKINESLKFLSKMISRMNGSKGSKAGPQLIVLFVVMALMIWKQAHLSVYAV